jgi:hypothetical protein
MDVLVGPVDVAVARVGVEAEAVRAAASEKL